MLEKGTAVIPIPIINESIYAVAQRLIYLKLHDLGIGFVNGTIIYKTGLPPFIVTYAMQCICQGAAYVWTGAQPIRLTDKSFIFLGTGFVANVIPMPLVYLFFILIFVWYIVIWVIVISFFVVDLALFASGLAAIVVGVISLAQLEPAAPVLVIGTGLCLIGISILLFIPLLKLAKVTGKLGKKTALWIKSWFVRRKKNA